MRCQLGEVEELIERVRVVLVKVDYLLLSMALFFEARVPSAPMVHRLQGHAHLPDPQ